MKYLKYTIVIICLLSLFIPFTAFAYFNAAESSESEIHYNNVKNCDLTDIYSNAVMNSRTLFVFIDTQSSVYKILEYKNIGSDDVSLSPANQVRIQSDYTSYVAVHTFSSNSSTVSTSTPTSNFDLTNLKLIALYPYKHASDTSYINIYKYSTPHQVTESCSDLPLYFTSEGYLLKKGTTIDSGSSGGDGGSSVDLTNTNLKIDRVKTAIDELKSQLVTSVGTVTGKLDTMMSKQEDIKTKLENIKTKLDTINTSIGALSSNVTTQFTGLKTYLTGKFDTLYNVIVYGNEEGVDESELQQMQLQNMETGMQNMNTSISNVPSVINSASEGLGSYIDTFTSFYNSLTALNVAISALLYLGLTFILVKKLIGR